VSIVVPLVGILERHSQLQVEVLGVSFLKRVWASERVIHLMDAYSLMGRARVASIASHRRDTAARPRRG